jgi:opacity protein-like surface antigen
MKKLFIAALFVVAAAGSAFAADANVNKVSSRVKNSFEARFGNPSDLSWKSYDGYLKAAFTIAGEKVEAFFGADGELIGTSRVVEFKQLPLNAIQKIQKDYAGYKVTEAIEFERDGEKSYYVALNNDAKKQVLEVSLYGSVSIFKKEAK